MLAFILWSLGGCLFAGFGVYALFTKKPMCFWANIEAPKVTDVKKYNRAMAKLYLVYALVFILLGLPLLAGQNSALGLLSALGVVFETIVLMAVYTLVIGKKYLKG